MAWTPVFQRPENFTTIARALKRLAATYNELYVISSHPMQR